MGTSLFIKCHFLVLLITSLNAIVSSDSDKSILLQFKASVLDPSRLLSSWTEAQSHCTFLGVSCDSNSRVVALNITGNGVVNCGSVYGLYPLYGFRRGRRECEGQNGKLGGNLPGVVAKLSGLKVLSLPFNGFVGEVPSEVWGMESLEVLDLEGNLLSGEVPRVGNLRVLNLGFNRIRGEVPRRMGSLEVLNLAGNEVNGSVPGFIGGVREVYLGFNRIGGEVPSEIGESCEKLERLDLSGNFLTGGIPIGLGNCSRLREVLLYSNMFEESIPVEFGKLKMLEVLDVSRNSLSGFIPAELGNCSELSVVLLSNLFNPFVNGGAGKGEESSEEFSSMIDDFNYFQGGIPMEISTLPKLRILWAPRATLEGRLPSDWGSCGSLEMVNLAQNFFTGEVPTGLTRCKKLHFLELSSNRLTGMLDADLQVPCMTMFDVSGNMLSGSIPNFYNGSCPPVYYVNVSSDFEPLGLASIYLSFLAKKALEGSSLQLRSEDHQLAVVHNFGSNNFTGTIQSMPISPERLGKQTAYGLFAGGNKFNGPLLWKLFENCDRLDIVMVNVSSNRISGQMPAEIGTLCKSLVNFDVSNNQITGPIPPTLWELVFLVALNLSDNLLHGKLPSGFSQLKSLKYLSLATNKLSGPIPSGLGQLHSLEILDLSSNSLSGRIPNDIVNLMNLTALLLNNNQLSGRIPSGLANMTRLSTFNVSYNNLSGPLPLNRNSMKCSSFIGNPSLRSCRMYTLEVPSSDPQGDDHAPHSGSQGWNRGNNEFNSIEIASIASASAIVAVLIALIIFFIYTRKWKPKSKIGSTTRKEVTIFTDIGVPITYEKVVMATGNFHASNCIGNGGFGATYKAEISPGVPVAIKRLAIGRFQGVQQFHAEIKTLGRLRHSNLVTLIGYHGGETEMFLIYNYLPGGNLEKFIIERSTRAVDWRVIHKIALDVARALAYLHDTCAPRVLHRDVKPSNILLDEDYNAYLSDFGLARLLGTSETHATTGVAGTFGYVAPEYAITCRVSDKADVYSYGVVLMELLSDKKVLDPTFSSYGNGFGIVQWACMLLRQGRANEFFTARLWDAGPHEDLVEVLHLAVMCTVDSLSTRPSISQVVRRLKQLQPPSC